MRLTVRAGGREGGGDGASGGGGGGRTGSAAAGPRELVLRRTRPVKQDRVAPDAERFRLYLVETGFWQRTETDSFDRSSLESELNRSAPPGAPPPPSPPPATPPPPRVPWDRCLRPGRRWRQQYRSDVEITTLLSAWQRRGWIIPAAGPQRSAAYHPRIRTLS